MAKELSTIKAKMRQKLKDTGSEFSNDDLDIYIDEVKVDISKVHPYIVKETLTADGTRDYSIASLANFSSILRCIKAEYPVDKNPRRFHNVWRYGNTVRIEIEDAPTTGESIYLYCEEIHTITDSSTTLDLPLQDVLLKGVVALAARAFLNDMRSDIVPSSWQWYANWAAQQYAIYQAALTGIRQPRVHEFYTRY